MNCADRDQDLALFAHGELGAIASASLRLHLKSCDRCRERLQTFTATSAALRSVLGAGPDQHNARSVAFGLTAFQMMRTFFLTLLAIGIVSGIWWAGYRLTAKSGSDSRIPVRAAIPCSPNLPNDGCR